MADTNAETPQDYGTQVSYWIAELDAAEKVSKDWMDLAKRIEKRYTLEEARSDVWEDESRFNILWSNVQTLMPAIFGREPTAVIGRRHKDQDPIGRVASEILERAISTDLDMMTELGESMGESMERVTLDLILTGRGVPWVRYVAETAGEGDQAMVLSETSPVEFLHWSEFLHAPRRTWRHVRKDGWVARRVDMTREQGVERFGDVFNNVDLTSVGPGMDAENMPKGSTEVFGRAPVWEIWDQRTKRVVWICKTYEDAVLDEREDPLRLNGFFPCPQPAFGTMSNANLIPVPDYKQYEALAEALDLQTRRIDSLTRALRVRGVYDQSVEGVGRLLKEEGEPNMLIAVSNMIEITGKGNLEGVVQFLPLKAIAEALVGLYDARDRTKQTLYEVSGIADVLRGVVDPREKLGQSQMKGQFAGQRIDSRRRQVERCARDTLRLKAEIMAEHYQPDYLRRLCGFDEMPEIAEYKARGPEGEAFVEELWTRAAALLKSQHLRDFRIDVETDSTVMTDGAQDQQRRIEFLQAASQILGQSVQAIEQMPQLGPLVGDLLLFAVRSFRSGRQLEASFERTVEQLRSAQQEAPQSGAEEAQAAADAERQAAEGQSAIMAAQAKIQESQARLTAIQAKADADVKAAQTKAALTEAEAAAKIAELEAELEKLAMEREVSRQKALTAIATGGNSDAS